ncbi:hypothetical protein [Flavobacterium adhaerens]|uniref:hypothetical protein n=1 Tax=Flavobacterium adhaerens TaxID=3149043 RepID=UPI0032B349C1
MAGRIETFFFFLHRQFERLNSLFRSKKISLIVAPLLTFSVAILNIVQISNGSFIVFNSIILCLAVIFTFLLTVSSVYFLRGDNIFNRYNREKSNSNLSQFKNSSRSSKSISEKKIKDLIDLNKEVINRYYIEFRKIELFNDDTSLNDFQILLANCLKKSKDNSLFKLEINANETHGFINEFIIPFLLKIDSNNVIIKKRIASLILYKKAGKYFPVNEKSLSDKTRLSTSPNQRKVYESVQIM